MAEVKAVQSQIVVMVVMVALFWVLLLDQTIDAFSEPVRNNPSNPAIKRSAFLVPLCWMAAVPLAFAKSNEMRTYGQWRRLSVQFTWAFPCMLLLLHIAIAFHLGHGWSHEAAWEHTKQAGGYGDGIFVNYAFALVWLLDALWLCVAFDSYFARPRWLNWTIHGFLAFVVFNAAVVFGSWLSRSLFIGCALGLGCIVWADRFNKRREAEKAQAAKSETTPVDSK